MRRAQQVVATTAFRKKLKVPRKFGKKRTTAPDADETIGEISRTLGLPFPNFRETACFCLNQNKFPRKQLIQLVKNPWFDRMTMFVILVNCVTLAMNKPCSNVLDCNLKCEILARVDDVIFGYFVAEMFLKIIAMGLVGRTSYLSDPWNRLDCFIVISGLAEKILKAHFSQLNVTAIRTIRVLRPLRAVNRIPSLRILVSLMLDTLPMMGNVMLLCFFVCLTFAICGVQLWNGLLHNRCTTELYNRMDHKSNVTEIYRIPWLPNKPFICSNAGGMHRCDSSWRNDLWEPTVCVITGGNGTECFDLSNYQHFNTCEAVGPDPFNGAISFDNVLSAFITIFVIIGLNGWVDVMYYVQDAHSIWVWIYFVSLIVIGSFYMLNLFLAVIASQFAVTKSKETARMEVEKALHSKKSRLIYMQKIINRTASVWKRRSVARESHRRRSSQQQMALQILPSIIEPASIGVNRIPEDTFDKDKCGGKSQKSGTVQFECQQEQDNDEDKPTCSKYIPTRKLSVDFDQVSATESQQHENLADSLECPVPPCCSGVISLLSAGQQWMEKLVNGTIFTTSIRVAILLNTITLAIEHHNQPHELTVFLEYSNFIFTALFGVEMLLKLIGLTPMGYIKDTFNLFDGTIVIFSIVELTQSGKGNLSVLRSFRLLRILKLVRFIKMLRRQLIIMWKCLNNVAMFSILLALFIFIFSLLGMVLFGGKFCSTPDGHLCDCTDMMSKNHNCICPRGNFDTVFDAFMTVFIIVTGNWCTILYQGMHRVGPWSALYFLAIKIVGSYIFFNLLVGILLEGFSETDSEGNQQDPMALPDKAGEDEIMQCTCENSPRITSRNEIAVDDSEIEVLHSLECPIHGHIMHKRDSKRPSKLETTMAGTKSQWNSIKKTIASINFGTFHYYSLFIFSPENLLRKKFQQLLSKPWFDNLVLSFITVNCIMVAMERPSIKPESLERYILTYSSYCFTAIFTLEMFIKVVASNLIIGGKTAYLHDGWNILDGFLVVVGLISISLEIWMATSLKMSGRQEKPKIIGMIRILRILRALRPLRVIQRAPGLKVVVKTIMSSMKPIGTVTLICAMFFTIFAILGVQLFMGKLHYCNGPILHNITTRTDCESHPQNTWVAAGFNFDDLGQALLTLFVLSTLDGWNDIMYQTMDVTDTDVQPIRNNSPFNCVYSIAFLLIVSFFVLNMFVGVVVENFQNHSAAVELEMKRRKNVKQISKHFCAIGIALTSGEAKLPFWISYSSTRMALYRAVASASFDIVISIVIGLNIFSMALEHYQMSTQLILATKILNIIFTAIIAVEAGLRLGAYGVKEYFKDRWNQFDMFIVIAAVTGIVTDEMKPSRWIQPSAIRIIRVLRLARVLKLLRMAKGIRSLLECVSKALPQVGNLSVLFILLFYIFAAIGVELFSHIDCEPWNRCSGMDEHANFKNFPLAFLTLFRVLTGDNWIAIMQDCMKKSASSALGPLFFVTFMLASTYILMNLVIAVLLKFLDVSSGGDEEDDD